MLKIEFVPLHTHSDYSILQSTAKVKNLVNKASELKFKSLAITDTMSLSGTYEFFQRCKEKNIKPILGITCLVISSLKNGHHSFSEIILLAKNHQGYTNLCNICSKGSKRGYKTSHDLQTEYDSYVTFEEILPFASDLIAISIFEKGIITQQLKNSLDLQDTLQLYKKTFPEFFVEIEKYPHQQQLAKSLIKASQVYDFNLIATNSVYYISESDAEAHNSHVCIGEKSLVSDQKDTYRFGSPNHYLKSQEEMQELFHHYPEFITRTTEVANLCNFEFWKNENHYPIYDNVKGDLTQQQYLKQICYEKIKFRYPKTSEEENKTLIERIEFELTTIERSGYASYFLVVWDFIQYAYNEGIPVGPGRGSGAGSVIAYLLEITDLDPIRYDLLFERFLNPERISPPDFDIDFCEKRRIEVIDYVVKKYGQEKVVQIGTFGKLKAKAVIKDVNRVLGNEVKAGDNLSKKLIDGKDLTHSLENSNDLKIEYEFDTQTKQTIDYALKLEGLTRQRGIHAAGVIISDAPITNYTATFHGKKGEIITHFDGPTCENLGLLKMDFLGLRTLTVIQEAIDLIEKNYQTKINFRVMQPDDDETYEIFQRGQTVAIFQFESPGMRKHLVNLYATEIEDLIAMNALYRPGPMEYIDDFIRYKKDPSKIIYPLVEMEEYLAETYGITVYQEQVMLLSQKLAGFTKGEADNLRKAMGKKQKDKLDKMRPLFIGNGIKKGHPKEVLEKIWSDWEAFTQYAFNKSHSTAYAWVAYQTAYLKRHYPLEFFTAYLNSVSEISSMSIIFDDCLEFEVKILQPDINKSQVYFSTEDSCIRFGLAYLKGSGFGVAEAIVNERQTNGEYTSFSDFCKRILGEVSYSSVDNMISTGAMDTFGHSRAALIAISETMLERAKEDKRQEEAGQGSLFAMFKTNDSEQSLNISIPSIPEWLNEEFFAKEKNILGSYISGHPLIEVKKDIKQLISHNIGQIKHFERKKFSQKMPKNTSFCTFARIRKIDNGKSKEGRTWAKITVEDESGFFDFNLGEQFNLYQEFLTIGNDIFLIGRIAKFSQYTSKKIYEIYPLNERLLINYDEIHLRIKDSEDTETTLTQFKKIIDKNRYNYPHISQLNLLSLLSSKFEFLKRHKDYKRFIEMISQVQSNLMAQIAEYKNWQLVKKAIKTFKIDSSISQSNPKLHNEIQNILSQLNDKVLEKASLISFRLETADQLIFYKTSYLIFLNAHLHQELTDTFSSEKIYYRLKE